MTHLWELILEDSENILFPSNILPNSSAFIGDDPCPNQLQVEIFLNSIIPYVFFSWHSS